MPYKPNTARYARRKQRTGNNPIESPEQYGLMQAVAHGTAKVEGIGTKIAREMIEATPSSLRKIYAKALAKMRKNPTDDFADRITAEFHGRKPQTEKRVRETEIYDDRIAELATTDELRFLSGDRIIKVTFKKSRPALCANSYLRLELVGGDQSLNIDSNKDISDIGWCLAVAYHTDKHHLEGSDGTVAPYGHVFGEEFYKEHGLVADADDEWDQILEDAFEEDLVSEAISRRILPFGTYDKRNEKILLVGGKYTIEDVGIKG